MLTTLLAACLQSGDDEPPIDGTLVPTFLYAPDCTLSTWEEPCIVKSSANPSPAKTEVEVIANPKDPMNAIAASKDLDRQASDCVWSVAQVTHDGGRTWKTVYVGGKKSDRGPTHPLYGWNCVTDPIMAFDKNGVAFYALQAYDYRPAGAAVPSTGLPVDPTAGSAFFLARSRDGGDTWENFVPMHVGDGTAVFHDYPRMASNPKTASVYAVWNQIDVAVGVPVVVASRDGGATTDAPVYVAVDDQPGGVGQSGIAAAADGTVYLMLGGFFNGGPVYFTRSVDDGKTFAEPWNVFNITPMPGQLPNSEFRTGSSVEIGVDASGGARDGWIYAVWPDHRSGDTDLLSVHSADGGASWSKPVRVNQDATKNDQWMPRVTVTQDGVVHVIYFTRAYDPKNKLIDAEYAYSEDGGATWVTQRLTASSFDGDKGKHQSGFAFIGDYNGIASSGNRVYAGFPDTITGVAELAVAVLHRGP